MTNLTLKAQETFAKDLYATEVTGIVIEMAEERMARCSLNLTVQHRNAMGAVMGGVMFTLADFAFAIAANSSCLAEGKPLAWVSLGSSIQYLSQTKGNRLTAETSCIKQGRSTCVYNITIYDENNTTLALVTTTGMRIN